MLPDRSIRNKFLTEDLSAWDFNAEIRIFKKIFFNVIESFGKFKRNEQNLNLLQSITRISETEIS